jgi:protein-S-isoprenylcysteine O-methyltransferase Ste14
MNRGAPSPQYRQVVLGIILIVVGWVSINYSRESFALASPLIPVIVFTDLTLVFIAIGLVIRFLAFKEIRCTHRMGHLVTSGIYSRTRNPIYLSFTLIILGIALYFDTLPGYAWVLISLIGFYWIAKREEGDLEHVFGEEYIRYKERVPMFLGHSHWKEKG